MLGEEPGKGAAGPQLFGEVVMVEGAAVAEILRHLLVHHGVEAVEQAAPRVRGQAPLACRFSHLKG